MNKVSATVLGLCISTSAYGIQTLNQPMGSFSKNYGYTVNVDCQCNETYTNIGNINSSFSGSEYGYVVNTKVEDVYNMSTELTRNLNKLNKIKELELLSHGNQISFSSEFIDSISKILLNLNKQPEVFPNYSGNIQLEFTDKHDKKYLEIEINPNNQMIVFKIDKDGNEFEDEDYELVNLNRINEEIDLFYAV